MMVVRHRGCILGAGFSLSLGMIYLVTVGSPQLTRVPAYVDPQLFQTYGSAVSSEGDGYVHDTAWTVNITRPETDGLHLKRPTMRLTPDFLPHYKNPCWREAVSGPGPGLPDGWKIRCLPYYYIVGQPKCGTTDLYDTLNKHPDVTPGQTKEPHWWARRRVGKGKQQGTNTSTNTSTRPVTVPLDNYINYFSGAAKRIAEGAYRRMITSEASASTLWDNDNWRTLADNANLTQPKYLTAHYLHALQPDAKIIVILRNPTDRLYSDYLYFNKKSITKEEFHKHTVHAIAGMNCCLERNELKSCVYNSSLSRSLRVRLRIGMYYAFIRDWLEVFPRDQIHIVRLEDYAVDRLAILSDVYNFLDLAPLPAHVAQKVETKAVSNQRHAADRAVGAMLQETRVQLDEFYGKYNSMLADLLKDQRFLWKERKQDI